MKLCSLLLLLLWLSGEASGFFHLFHTATKVVGMPSGRQLGRERGLV